MINRKHIFGLAFFSILIAIFFLSSCRKDDIFNEDSGFRLEFSSDTVYFDTVFTTIGSVTKQLKVFNRSDKAVKISRIFLPNGSQSNYRINVDGIASTSFENVIIEANDSMYVFVEVTIDPNSTTNPMVVTDSIIFQLNGIEQDIDLVAFGRDAYFHIPNHPATQYLPAAGTPQT
jgi:hypothetical protein